MAFSVIVAILLFGLIIFIHELGHFVTAKRLGVTINEFSVGMGPKLFSKVSEDGISYSLRLLPVGGYVSMAGEDESSDDPNAFCNISKKGRFAVLFAGAFMNLLLGLVLMVIYVCSANTIYSNKIESFLVADNNGQMVSEYQGLLPGDEIVAIGKANFNVRYDYIFSAMRTKGEPCDITVIRNGEKIKITDFVLPTITEDGIVYGNPNFFIPAEKEKSFGNIIYESFFQTISAVKIVAFSLFDLVTGNFSVQSVSGPVGVVDQINTSVSYGFASVMFLAAIITINVGIFNLLPFPALDGGRIAFLAIEAIIRRPINKKIEAAVNFAGLMILFSLMIAITFKDIIQLIQI